MIPFENLIVELKNIFKGYSFEYTLENNIYVAFDTKDKPKNMPSYKVEQYKDPDDVTLYKVYINDFMYESANLDFILEQLSLHYKENAGIMTNRQ